MNRDIEITLGSVVEKAAPDPKPVLCFAHCPALDADPGAVSVRAANFARQVLNRICGNQPGTIIEGWPEESEYRHLWHITLRLAPTRGTRASVSADYSAMPDCPLEQRQEMMQIYRAFRKAMREGAK